jgi:ribonuclease P protein component
MAPHERFPDRFPKAARLASPVDFARVYEFRRSAASGPIVLYACPSRRGAAAAAGREAPVRLGVSVSRRIGNAVVRNRWKRRLREAFRAVRERLPAGNDLVVVVRSGAAPVGAEAARQMEETLVSLAGRVIGRPGYAAAAETLDDAVPERRGRRR